MINGISISIDVVISIGYWVMYLFCNWIRLRVSVVRLFCWIISSGYRKLFYMLI